MENQLKSIVNLIGEKYKCILSINLQTKEYTKAKTTHYIDKLAEKNHYETLMQKYINEYVVERYIGKLRVLSSIKELTDYFSRNDNPIVYEMQENIEGEICDVRLQWTKSKYIIFTILDISEQHKAEQRYQEAMLSSLRAEKSATEANLQSIRVMNAISENAEAVIYLDLQHDKYSILKSVYQYNIFAESGEYTTTLLQYIQRIVHMDFQGILRENLSASILRDSLPRGSGQCYSIDFLRKISGKSCWARVSVYCLRSIEEEAVEATIIIKDIDKEVRVRQQQDIVSAFAKSYHKIEYYDLELHEIYNVDVTNAKLKRLTQKQVRKNHIEIVETSILPEYRAHVLELQSMEYLYNKIMQGVTSIEYEYAYKKKNRLGTYWSRINAVLATDERNKPKFVVIGYLDITKQKKCEMEYQESLQKALFAAKTANNEKSRFLSNMSHDIRTPMNSIIGMTSIATLRMEEGPVDVECQRQVKDCLSNIDVASRHLLGLINDVLDMSRIESGCFQLHEEEFEIHDFVCSVNAIIQQQISEKSIEYIVEEAVMKDGVVKGDRTRLTQVVLNVLGNAVKYTPVKGRIVLRIREEELENGKRAMYQIDCEDTGCGIDEEFLPHIFDMFTQEQKRCSESYPGTGLGMSIAKSIIDLMQGTIHVKSEINKGTLFTIRVPLKICKSIPISRAKDSLLLEHKSILSNRNILVVEDLDMNAEVIRILIEMQGGTVTVVTNGKSAVETLCDSRENTYDAILMDIRMPIMDGYEATKRIRRFDRRDAQYIPIIAMSADAFEENIQESYNAGMNAHIAKPVRLELLEEVLEKYFNKEIQDDKTKEDT